jgi:signal transduction histidine kinase/class 3 adenylate cyclase/DNA-binding CsgD family transcriptional regulator
MTGEPGELEYYRRQLDELAGENQQLQLRMQGLGYALAQKRQGFAVLSELQQSVGAHQEVSSIFEITLNAIKGMERTVVLTPTTEKGHFRPAQWVGFHPETAERLRELDLEFPEDITSAQGFLLVNRSTEPTPLIEEIRTKLELPFFVCVPVMGEAEPIGLLLSGRLREARPSYPPLDQGDVDTFVAVAGLISASIRNLRLAVLEEMDRVKTEFFANISHEFRTPLMLTLGPLEQILHGRAGEVPDKVVELTEVMHRNQRRLLELINQILDLTKFEAAEMQLRAAPFPEVDRFVAERVDQFRPLAEKRGVDLRTDLAAGAGGSSLFVDREKFDRLVNNLLSNAVKFTPEGHVEVSTAIEGQSFVLSVRDTGVGIKHDELPRVFDRFRQADGGEARQFEGTGIGLALVKEITKLHGGTVSAQSEYGEGSRFTVTIPLGKGHLSPATVVDAVPEDGSATAVFDRPMVVDVGADPESVRQYNEQTSQALDTNRATVLYVEDNPDLRRYVADLLVPHYNVFLAVDGQDGFEKARLYQPDLILSDEMMPRVSGRQLLAELRGDAELGTVPVVFLTARAAAESRIESLDAGADDYLAKPFHEGELLARVRALLRSRAQERELERLNRRLEAKVEEQVGELVRTGELRRFLPTALAEAVMQGRIGPPEQFERRRVTALFADMVGFTALSDRLEPEEVSAVVNDFLREMAAVAVAHGGTVDKFIGDEVMVLYGVPVRGDPEDEAWAAVRSAWAMRSTVHELRARWRRRGVSRDFGVRIGINTGYCTVGVFGSDQLQSYTAIGTPVNVAARLRAQAAPDGIVCGFTTHALVQDRVRARALTLTLPGIAEPVDAFEVLEVAGADADADAGPTGSGPTTLTRREREVARLAADGHTAREIAGMLFIAERTVETHLARVYDKLGVRSKVELAKRASELDL